MSSNKNEVVWREVARLYLLRRVTKPMKKLYLSSSPSAPSTAPKTEGPDYSQHSSTMTLSWGAGQGTAWRTTIWNWYSKAGRGVYLSFPELDEIYTTFWSFLDGQQLTTLDFDFNDNRSLKVEFENDRATIRQKRGSVESEVELGREEIEKVVANIPAFQLCRDLKDEPDTDHFRKIGEVFAAQSTIDEVQRLIESESIFSATTGLLVTRVLTEHMDDIRLNFENLMKALREAIGLKQTEIREIKNAGLLLLAEDGDFPVIALMKRLDGEEEISTLEKISRTLFFLMKDNQRRQEYHLKRAPKDKAVGKKQKLTD